MTAIDGLTANFRRLDQLARGDTAIHRLDARAKVLATLAFVVAVTSFDKYTVAALLPFFVYPAALAARAGLPTVYLVQNVVVALPFALAVGLCNPIFDRQVVLELGSLAISGGWMSCLSIVIRALLTLGAALVLVAATGFPAVCEALQRLGMPKVFAVQLQFLYRYIFVLLEDATRSARALKLRSSGRQPRPGSVAALLGCLLLRTWQRAERIHLAMQARACRGEFHRRNGERFGSREVVFVVGWMALFCLLRCYDVSRLLGSLVASALP